MMKCAWILILLASGPGHPSQPEGTQGPRAVVAICQAYAPFLSDSVAAKPPRMNVRQRAVLSNDEEEDNDPREVSAAYRRSTSPYGACNTGSLRPLSNVSWRGSAADAFHLRC